MALINKPDISKIWASTGSKVAPLDAKIATGWIQEMMPAEWENFLQNRTDVMLNHISQRGIPEWDAVTEYQAGRSYVTSSSGTVYRAVTTNTNIAPSSDSGTNWVKAFVTTNDVFVSSASNIGIGTTAPTGKLDVRGSLVFGSSTTPLGSIFNDSLAVNVQANASATGGLKVGTSSATPLSLYTNGIGRVNIAADGLVGVNMTPNLTNLDIKQNTTYALGINNSAATQNYSARIESAASNALVVGSRTTSTDFLWLSSVGNLGIGAAPLARLHSSGVDGGAYALGLSSTSKGMRVIINSAGTLIQGVDSTLSTSYQPISLNGTTVKVGAADAELLTVSANGVGIGTEAPVAKLDITLTGSSGISQSLRTITAPSVIPAYALGAGIEFSWYAVAPSIRLAHGGDGNSAGLAFSTAFSGTTVERMRIDQVGNIGIGAPTPATKLHVSTSGADCEARIETITSGNPRLSLNASGTIYNWLQTNRSTGALEFAVNNTVVATLDGAGAFLLKYSAGGGGIGYGPGAGGIVTQTGSKQDAVTLNKPTGRIVCHNQLMASGSFAMFALNNSTITENDCVVVTLGPTGYTDPRNYQVVCATARNGSAIIIYRNMNTGSLGEAITLNFIVHRGAVN